MPEPHGHLVRNKQPLAGVFEKSRPEFARRVKRPENIPAGAVIKTGNLAEDLALGALAAAGSAENENGSVT